MHVLQANKVQRDTQVERGVARRWCERPTMLRGEECASMRSMKRGAGVCTCVESYWTYGGMDGEKRRGEVYMCLL